MGLRRLIDMPEESAAEWKAKRRSSVLLSLLYRKSEDEIYREEISVVIEAAREEGCDEHDVEVIAAQARRDIADALADFREPREGTDWKADVMAALALQDEIRAYAERKGEAS
jgi:hypothetical protein